MSASAGPAYSFGPNERPMVAGGPFNPSHPRWRRIAYFFIGILTGITGGLGNALVSVNLASIQGALGLGPVEGAWLPAAYVATNVCANLVLVRMRVEFGLQRFVQYIGAGLFITGERQYGFGDVVQIAVGTLDQARSP